MTKLADALVLVGERMSWPAGKHDLERVEVDRRGRVVLTARASTGYRWFEYSDGELRELLPREDRKVPLCAELSASEAAEIVSWRPGRRVCLPSSWDGEPCFVKGYRARRSTESARKHALAAAACWRPGSFALPAVLHHSPERSTVTLATVPGSPLPVSSGRTPAFFRVGQALRFLQRDLEAGELPDHDVADELDLLRTLAARFQPVLGELPPDWEAGMALVESREAPGPERAACHRDLHPEQLLHSHNAMGLVDLDLLCRAHPMLDLANLTAHLRLRALQGLGEATHADADDCAHATLDGYGPELDADQRHAFRFFQSTTFLRLALIYAIRPRWAHLSVPLVRLAHRCLDD